MGRWGHFGVAALASFLLSALPVAADDAPSSAPDVEKVCAARACRSGGYEAAVFVDSGRYTRIPVTRSPYILDDGAVLVFPGETVAVQFAPDGDKLGPPISAQRYAAHFPALIVVKADEQPTANPDDTTLPVVNGKLPADEVAKLPPNTLLISYGQFKPVGEKGMTLILEQNLSQRIKLDAIVAEISPSGYKQHYTSTCPILPKMLDNEMWPNALGPIVLRNFRFQGDSNSVTCQ